MRSKLCGEAAQATSMAAEGVAGVADPRPRDHGSRGDGPPATVATVATVSESVAGVADPQPRDHDPQDCDRPPATPATVTKIQSDSLIFEARFWPQCHCQESRFEQALETEMKRFTGDPDPSDTAVDAEHKRLTRAAFGTDLSGIDVETYACRMGVGQDAIRMLIMESAKALLKDYHLEAKTQYSKKVSDAFGEMKKLARKSDHSAHWSETDGSAYANVRAALNELPDLIFNDLEGALDRLANASAEQEAARKHFSEVLERASERPPGRPSDHFRKIVVSVFCRLMENPKYYTHGSRAGEGDALESGPGPALVCEILKRVGGVTSAQSSVVEAIKKTRSKK